MIRKELFNQINGFDEEYEVIYSDLDICLKLRKAGYLIVYTPLAQLYHLESITRGLTPYPNDDKLFYKKWSEMLSNDDQYYNCNLSKNPEESFYWKGFFSEEEKF
jgi:O-antigen biosynthesis protein